MNLVARDCQSRSTASSETSTRIDRIEIPPGIAAPDCAPCQRANAVVGRRMEAFDACRVAIREGVQRQ